ncbi:MAG TPA: D-aminoacyl-tRNA deacylase [Clostridiales bacterium]|nr:MAG: D-tyrosyl-tRNA(Tyr) deacylase [Firmicutes bacterium ADurb.Bin262]HOU10940.1 D-aminoacyl-tRNA deacylase [Clostridiales bacterium]HQH62711.1 D-aminoacyl-tRNA deacylase [Clostridiales bacterium]HQK72941.1 D-aminoacyl-tRNA deacylase [Clostridiales bacterium]
MKAVVQRVLSSSVTIRGAVTAEIGPGLTILLAVTHGDNEDDARKLAEKIAGLRIFNDEAGKMNRSVRETDGEALVVSQFTLFGDCRKGNRPSFSQAAEPETANRLYELFVRQLAAAGVKTVRKGVFAADMKVQILNDGPVTLIIDTDDLKKSRRNPSSGERLEDA